MTIDLSKPEDTANALSVAIPAGEGPDIIGWANDPIGDQALAGNIVPLDDHGITMSFLEETYEPAAVRGVVWQGKIWALPETQEGIAFVYNKALVDEKYLPTDPLDFDALLEKAKAFYEDTGKYLVCNQGLGNPDPYHAAPIYFGFGVPEYVDDQGNVYLNTPEAIAAAKWMVKFREYAPGETSHDICKAMLVDGDAGAWWTGPWAIADLEAAGIDYGILPMGRPFVGIKTLMLSVNAVDRGNAEVALDIMKCFTSAEVQKKLALVNKTIPAATAALQDPEVQTLPTLAGFGAAMSLGVPMANTPYASAQWGPVGDATTAVWTGAQTPEEAMAAAQEAIWAGLLALLCIVSALLPLLAARYLNRRLDRQLTRPVSSGVVWLGGLVVALLVGWLVDVPEGYNTLLESGNFIMVNVRTILYVVVCMPLFFITGLVMALILNNPHIRALTFFRVVLIVPWAASTVAIMMSLVWQFFFRERAPSTSSWQP